MPNYQQTKIYKIVSNQTDKIYVGSTCQPYLSSRMNGHRHDYKNPDTRSQCESVQIMKYKDAKIRLIENYPCCSREEQLMREQFFIDTMKCVNKYASYTSPEDLAKWRQEWTKNNPEKMKVHREKMKVKKNTCPLCYCKLAIQHQARHIKTCFSKSVDGLNQILLEEKKELSSTEKRENICLYKRRYNNWNRSMEGLNKICID